MGLGVLQLVFKAWNSFKGWYGMCLQGYQPKCTSGLSCGPQSAAGALFLQEDGVFVFEEV